MRFCLRVLATMLGLVMFATGNAHADVPRTLDANGVLVGSWIAPVQLEVFCEPQCPHCAEFEAADGDKLAAALAGGRVAITYRWLMFLDRSHHNDVSARLVNALFLAADPASSPTAYQAFVQDLYRHQNHDGPTNDAVAAMARESGLPDVVADRIAAGDGIVDAQARQRREQGPAEGREPGAPRHPDDLQPEHQKRCRHSRSGLAGRADQLTVQPLVHPRQAGQRGRGDQPAHHGDRTGRDDRELGVTVLHANQIRVALVVLDVNPHARGQFGWVQHAELGPVGHPVGRDELDGRAPRTRVEDLGLGHAHIVLNRNVIAHSPGHQQ